MNWRGNGVGTKVVGVSLIVDEERKEEERQFGASL